MAETSHKSEEGGKSFVVFPVEIQLSIIRALYSSLTRHTHYTAFLRTCKYLHRMAYPIFLASYPLSCSPIKPNTFDARPGFILSDIYRIVHPHDSEQFQMHLVEEDWMRGLRNGMKDLYEIQVKDEDEYEDYDESIHRPDTHPMGDAPLFQRAEYFAQYWIRKNSLAKLLRQIGNERAQRLGTLCVTWEGWEKNSRGELLKPGPYAVGLMSVVCSLFLPNIKYVALQQTKFTDREDSYYIHRFGLEPDFETEGELWPDHLRPEIMADLDDGASFSDQGYMIKAIRLMLDACGGLEVLALNDWRRRGRSQWWREKLEKKGLVIQVNN